MTKRWTALLCTLACALAPLLSGVDAPRIRPDDGIVWPAYEARSQVVEVDLDTNADGRPDVEEYFYDGALLRRDSDRNFDGRVDLIEEFDSVTRQEVRSIVDDDYDGVADRLLLFRNGALVFSERRTGGPAASATAVARGHRIFALLDPFSADTTLRSHLGFPPSQPWVGVSGSAGLAEPLAAVHGILPCRACAVDLADAPSGSDLTIRSPRGPPLA